MKGCPTHPEFDSIYIGFSRDGYSWTKPPAGQPLPLRGVGLSPSRRGPFLSMAPSQIVGKDPDPASKSWNCKCRNGLYFPRRILICLSDRLGRQTARCSR